MFDEDLDLSEVLARLKRADESLAECIAPLWPGVSRVAAWIEGKPRLYLLDGEAERAGYYLLGVDEEGGARILRPAEETEAARYRGYLTKASVILLEDGLAFPASSVERLQGITGPWPIHFAEGEPLQTVQARFDGLNLYFDGQPRSGPKNALDELLGGSIFAPGAFGIPDEAPTDTSAEGVLEELRANPERAMEYRLRAVLETAHAELEDWLREGESLRVRWRVDDTPHSVYLSTPAAPITSGISLAGARAFDPAQLTRLLVGHILDGWRA